MYNRCLERGSDEYKFSDYTKRIMDGSPELLFLNEATSLGSVKTDLSPSSVTNSGLTSFEHGHSGSVSQPGLETAHIGIHSCLGAESIAKTDEEDLDGQSTSSISSTHFGSNSGQSCDSAPVTDPSQVEFTAMPPGASTDMTIRIRRKTTEVSELSTVHSTHSEFDRVVKSAVLRATSGDETGRVRRGRPKKSIEENHLSVPIPPDTDFLNSITTSSRIERNEMEDETLEPVFFPGTASTGLAKDGEMFCEEYVSAELSLPIEQETLVEAAQNYTVSLPLSLPVSSSATILKILKKRKMRNPNVLTESSVPLSELTPLDAAYRQPRGEQNSDPL
jgi:hypothetical protein